MNCKPGDLAVVTQGRNRDKLAEVVSFMPAHLHHPSGITGAWPCRLRGGIASRPGEPARVLDEGALPDAWLRPIRDPGDGATDETLIYAGKPQREIA
jgi:hypothetical protein